jgi:hypothetical protein
LSGLAFLPFSAGITVSAGIASQFAPRVGVLLALLLASLGMGAVFMPLTTIATTAL